MPQLPSGRHVGIHCLSAEDIIRKVSRTHPEVSLLTLGMKVKEVDSIDAIKPYISVLFVRESNNTEDNRLDKRSQTNPEGTEPYDSGFTLAETDQFTANWSVADKQAFADFLGSEKVASYFQDVINKIQDTGTWYHQNLLGMIDKTCESTTDEPRR